MKTSLLSVTIKIGTCSQIATPLYSFGHFDIPAFDHLHSKWLHSLFPYLLILDFAVIFNYYLRTIIGSFLLITVASVASYNESVNDEWSL